MDTRSLYSSSVSSSSDRCHSCCVGSHCSGSHCSGCTCVGYPCVGPFSTDMTLALLNVMFNRETDVSGVDVSGVNIPEMDVPVYTSCNMFGMDASGLCPIYQRELCECIQIMDMSGNPIVELDLCIVDVSSNETDVSCNET
jgi:hypothetical protein